MPTHRPIPPTAETIGTESAYCWQCYVPVEHEYGTCVACGHPVQEPPEARFTDRLLWTLHHPLRDRRLIAALLLGARREIRAIGPLRLLLTEEPDPYLAAAYLEVLVHIAGAAGCRDLLDAAARSGPGPARTLARRLLE